MPQSKAEFWFEVFGHIHEVATLLQRPVTPSLVANALREAGCPEQWIPEGTFWVSSFQCPKNPEGHCVARWPHQEEAECLHCHQTIQKITVTCPPTIRGRPIVCISPPDEPRQPSSVSSEHPTTLAYSARKIIEILSRQMDPESAAEYFEFNIFGAHMGEHGPTYIFD